MIATLLVAASLGQCPGGTCPVLAKAAIATRVQAVVASVRKLERPRLIRRAAGRFAFFCNGR